MGWTTPSNNWEILEPPPFPELTEPLLLSIFLRGFLTFSEGIRDQFFHTMFTQPGKSLLPFSTGLGKKVVPRLRECCRQSQAEVVSKSGNKIHQTWGPPFSRVLSQMTSVARGRGIGHILTTGREVA